MSMYTTPWLILSLRLVIDAHTVKQSQAEAKPLIGAAAVKMFHTAVRNVKRMIGKNIRGRVLTNQSSIQHLLTTIPLFKYQVRLRVLSVWFQVNEAELLTRNRMKRL